MTKEKSGNRKNKKNLPPLAIHPDDAKDKVFSAILKALLKINNKPSSPKELANTIVKHKYATLGGQTPFATVSSRISQHFKRAAEHNPPRPPLLTKHVDQNHSRKINYSLATEEKEKLTTKQDDLLSDTSSLSSEEEEEEEVDQQSPIVKPITTTASTTNSSTMLRTSNIPQQQQEPNNDDDDIAAAIAITKLSQIPEKEEDDDSEAEYSDYYEEMLLGDDMATNIDTTTRRRSTNNRKKSSSDLRSTTAIQQSKQSLSAIGENEYWAPFSFEQEEFDSVFLPADANTTTTTIQHNNQTLLNITSPESIPISEFDSMFNNNITKTNNVNNTNTPPPSSSPPPVREDEHENTNIRRKSWPDDDCNKLASSFTTGEEIKSGKKERFEIITSTFKGHTFKIMKKCIGNMECYELESPDDIPDTKVLRFISSTSSQHVALKFRYRSGSTAADNDSQQDDHQISNLQHGFVNATQLRKAATPVLGGGVFDADEEKGHGRTVVVIAKGPSEARGAWVPLLRARELVEEFEIESSPGLSKLMSNDPLDNDDDANSVSVDQDYSLSSPASIDFSSQLTDSLVTESNTSNSSLISENTKLPTPDTQPSNVQNEESFFVKFEDDEKKPPVTTISPQKQQQRTATPPRKHAKIAPSTKHLSTSEILKSMNIQNLNLSALQQMMTAMPNLAQISPQNLHLAKTLTAYMQSINNSRPIPSLSAPTPSIPSTSTPMNDLKNTLSRIPLFDALLSKQQPILPQPAPKLPLFSDSNATTSTSSPFSSSSPKVIPSPLSTDNIPIIYPTQPTDPPMSITVIDNIAVCIAVLRKHSLEEDGGGEEKEYRLMRRLDNGFINGTQLLTAGGIETESERSMILSFEMSRVRMPNKKSALFGTWIPSRRAQELAATCSIQHALGAFLDDDIEILFPSPLPVPVTRKVRSNSLSSVNISKHHLAAITLAALKNTEHEPVNNKRNSIDSTGSSSAAATNNDQLLTHPNNTLKTADYNTLQAPLLGRFADTDGDRRITVIDKPVVVNDQQQQQVATSIALLEDDVNSDIDIESDDVTVTGSDGLVKMEYDSMDEDTDTDNDVEEVRKEMRKIRDAAIAAMEIGNSMQLDDIFQQHASSSSQPLYPPPQDSRKRRRKHSSGRRSSRKRRLKKNDGNKDNDQDEEEDEDEDEDEEMDAIKNHFINLQHATPYKSFSYSKKRPVGASGGKWSAASVVGKMAPTAIKRSATWSSSMDTPSAKKQKQNIKDVNSFSIKSSNAELALVIGRKDEVMTKNVVPTPPVPKVSKKKASAAALIMHTVVNEDDEDEDVDIGGSDNDDDLR